MGRLLHRVAVVLAVLAALPAQGTIDWERHGQALLKALGESTAPTLQDLLARHYTRFRIGEFDLRIPTGMVRAKEHAPTIAALASATLDLQARLDALLVADAEAVRVRAAEAATVRKTVAAWRNKPVALDAMATPGQADPCVVVIAPDRRAFAGLVGWLGLWKPQYRGYWWNDGTTTFCDLRLEDENHAQIVALEYAAPEQNADGTAGFDMNTREKTGMLQHFLQRAAMSWCWRHLRDDMDAAFVSGFATDLVIDVLGENNARSGGSGRSKATEGEGGFIPGAPGRGGGMLMILADSAWRLSLGKEYFARVLRQAQTSGDHAASGSKDKLGHFLVRATKGSATFRVDAPFVGKVAFDREPVPEAFLDDYLEFHRAYRAAFVHWLETKSAKGRSGEQFRALMLRAMERKSGDTLEVLCQDVYGVPLASKTATDDTLERRFLAWLAAASR